MSLDSLTKEIQACDKCQLSQTRTKAVPGEGKITNPVLFIIGEAPGREEDQQGKPFVGGAGRILNSILKNVGVDRSLCYITNVCKCRPPNNRTPKLDEIQTCKAYLQKELDLISPQRVLLLGETATLSVLSRELKVWRGTIVTLDNKLYLPTYHPAFLMRNRDAYPIVVWDVNKLLNTTPEKLKSQPHQIYRLNPPDWLEILTSWMNENKPIAIDIETKGVDKDEKGLDPHEGEIIGIGFCGEEGNAFSLTSNTLTKNLDILAQILSSYPRFVYQNNLFDRTFLRVKLNVTPKLEFDTKLAMHILNSNLPKSLDFLRSIYTYIEPYKHVYRKKGKVSHLSFLDLAQYNCLDVDVTLRSRNQQIKFMTPKQRELMNTMIKIEDVLLYMRTKGVKVDVKALDEHYNKLNPQAEEIKRRFKNEFNVDINSPKQLLNLLNNNFALELDSTNEQSLKSVVQKLDRKGDEVKKEIIESILKYRELSKQASVYCESVKKLLKANDMLYPDWISTGPDTGRWSCKSPNMQNFPKHMRNIIIPDDESCSFIGADYNRIELWIAALLSEDDELLSILERDEDVHQKALEAIEECYPLTKEYGPTQARVRAKSLVFGTLYGRTPKSIAMEFHVPIETAKKWQDAFYRRFHKLRTYMEVKIPEFWQKHGYVETPFGFRKYTDQITQAKNHMIQSTAAEVMKRSGLNLLNNGFDLRISVHDQWVAQVSKNELSKRSVEFVHLMETSCPELHHRFPVEMKTGLNWKEVS